MQAWHYNYHTFVYSESNKYYHEVSYKTTNVYTDILNVHNLAKIR